MTVQIIAYITSHLALELSLQVFQSLITFQHSGGGVVNNISQERNGQQIL
jgi:hypothetical protein